MTSPSILHINLTAAGDPAALLARARRALAPGGELVLLQHAREEDVMPDLVPGFVVERVEQAAPARDGGSR